jgi:hypothetical protein
MDVPRQEATHVLAVLEAERELGFDGLAGSWIDARLPLRQAALDAALAQVARWPSAVEGVAVEIGEGNWLTVTATVRVFGFRTPVRLPVRLAPSMDDGLVRLVISDGSLVGSAIALLGPLLGKLPDGLTLEGRQIVVDVRRLGASAGLGDLASMLSTATFESTPGVLWILVKVVAPASAPPMRQSSANVPFHIDLASVRVWLQGSRVDVDLRMNERLANDLLTALHADLQLPSGDDRRDIMTSALHPPVVRFESGAVRLSATASLDDEGQVR